MRNIFDQYSQPENQLTHSLACVLHHDRGLLKSFLKTFGPETHPQVKALNVIEQGLPGTYENHGGEDEERGLPDAVIFDDEGWALIIESKISSPLTGSQLRRHDRTITKCGYEDVSGLTITVDQARICPGPLGIHPLDRRLLLGASTSGRIQVGEGDGRLL